MDVKAAIKTQFIKIYEKKDFSRITVKELCESAPAARTTFYAHYDNLDQVKGEIEDELVKGLITVADEISGGNLPDMDFIDFLGGIQKYIESNWDAFRVFTIVQPNTRFIEKWKDGIKFNFKRRDPEKSSINNQELVAEVIASATIGMYTCWMKNPDEVSMNDMRQIISKTLDAVMQIL